MACLEHRRQVSPVRGPQDSSATSARGDGCPNVHAYDKTVLGFDCCSGLLVYAVAVMVCAENAQCNQYDAASEGQPQPYKMTCIHLFTQYLTCPPTHSSTQPPSFWGLT